MKKSTILLLVSIISFIVSGIFTIIWFTSDCGSVFSLAFLLSFGMALVFEVMKITSGVLAFVEKWMPMQARVILGIISISLFLYSVLASSGYLTNQSNQNKNSELQSSIPYLQSIESREIKKQRLNAIQKEKEVILSRKSEISAEGNKIVNSMPKNYIDRKNQQRNTTQKRIDTVQSQYNNLDAEQSKLTTELQTVIDMSNIQVLSEKGSSSISNLIAKFLNKIDPDVKSPYTTEGVEMFLKIFASILFDVIAWTAAVIYPIAKQTEGDNHLSPTPSPTFKQKIPRPSDTDLDLDESRTIQNGRLKGLRLVKLDPIARPRNLDTRPSDNNTNTNNENNISAFRPKNKNLGVNDTPKVSNIDIEKYLDYIYKNQKNGIAPGRNKIAIGTGIPQEKCRTIHNILIHRGILETGHRCTKIIEQVV